MTLTEEKKSQDFESVLPLINIIFLLLIFLVLGGIFTEPELLDVHPPESISDRESTDEPMQILLGKEGELAYDGREISLQRFRLLAQETIENNPDASIEIKADQKVSMRRVFELMEIVRESGYENFQLLTLRI